MVSISQTLIIRDADFNIIDTIELKPDDAITRADIRAIRRVHKAADVIERVTTTERRPS
ncbi:MAG: hypothetical protein ACOY3N_23455 [Bradyrhizobium sp.]|uniref:hypothetical protein n=1 Tax=Bradyrhizobium sp. TaxID=376 RepID=UPI003BF3CF4C